MKTKNKESNWINLTKHNRPADNRVVYVKDHRWFKKTKDNTDTQIYWQPIAYKFN